MNNISLVNIPSYIIYRVSLLLVQYFNSRFRRSEETLFFLFSSSYIEIFENGAFYEEILIFQNVVVITGNCKMLVKFTGRKRSVRAMNIYNPKIISLDIIDC